MQTFNKDTARICVSAALVKCAMPFIAKEDVRYYLNGVCIQPADEGGALIIATDGHMLVCIRDEAGRADKRCIVPLVAGDARYMRAGSSLCVDDEGRAWIDKEGKPTWISPQLEIDGKYPDLSALIGNLADYHEGLVGTFNPRLIDRIRKAAPGLYPQVRFFHRINDKEQSQSALFTLGATGFGLLMPMRSDHSTDSRTALACAIPAAFSKAA